MYVYVWKYADGTPFYVGLSKTRRRTDPLASTGRGWLCKRTLSSIDPTTVVVEVHITNTLEEGQALEQKLILQYGRIQLGTGTLTNLRPGGEGTSSMSVEGRARLREFVRANNPMHREDVRAKMLARMQTTHVRDKFSGENNPAKQPEVRKKLKALWQNPEFRAARIAEKIGRAIHSNESKQMRSEKLFNLPVGHPMREQHKVLNTDPAIREKRVAALRSPEIRAKISEALKRKWAERKQKI